jgi:hypothetical protein
MLDQSGAEVFWDHQVGTFTGIYGAIKVGLAGGEILTVDALEAAIGVDLSASTGAALQEAMLAHPYLANKRFVSKLQFMDLFGPWLINIYTAAKSSVAVAIELDRVNRAPHDQIELTDPRTIAGLQKMEDNGLIGPGDAQRISKGLPWQP